MSENAIVNFDVYTLADPDILSPERARSLGRIITALKGAYNPVAIDATIAEFIAHLSDHSNPHDVTSAQVPVDGDYLLQNVYQHYLSITTDMPPMTYDILVTKLMYRINLASGIGSGSSIIIAGVPVWIPSSDSSKFITATLMNLLYRNHNTDLNAHSYIIELLTPSLDTPVPTFCIDPVSAASDVYAFAGNAMEFLTNLAFIDILMFALGVPIFPQEPNAPAGYSSTLDITSYVPVINGTVLLSLYINPSNTSNVNVMNLANPSTGDSINIHQVGTTPNTLNIDIGYNGVISYNSVVGNNGYYNIYLTYTPVGMVINSFDPNFASSPVTMPGLLFQYVILSIGVDIEVSDPNACITNLAVYPQVLNEAQASLIFGLTQ